MSWTKWLSWVGCYLAVAGLVVFAAGCRQPSDDFSSSKATNANKTGDPADAEIQAERAKLNPEERKLVDAQEWCAVQNDERLGSMGQPLKLMVRDQAVFVCCKSCTKKALADPDATLAKVQELKAKKQAEWSPK